MAARLPNPPPMAKEAVQFADAAARAQELLDASLTPPAPPPRR